MLGLFYRIQTMLTDRVQGIATLNWTDHPTAYRAPAYVPHVYSQHLADLTNYCDQGTFGFF